MCKCIAPHEGEELMLVEEGIKPLAIIYHSKSPKLYREACRSLSCKRTLVRAGVIAIAQDQQTIRAYIGLVSNRKSYTREQYQRCMGKLLGYSNHEVEEFIQSEIGKTCTCIECGGEI